MSSPVQAAVAGGERRTIRLVLLCLALFLVVWPLTLARPGMPANLKADEPAYYLAARSLWEDHDLKCETRDLWRVTDEFLAEPNNLVLMSRDHWQTRYFGKPYFASLVAAPLVGLFGVNGYVALNMACLLLVAVLGYLHLRRSNGEAEAAVFSLGYFFVSASYAYVFWIEPEIANLTAVALALFLSLHELDPRAGDGPLARLLAGVFNDRTRWLWAGLAIGAAVNSKPIHIIFLLPGAVAALSRRSWRNLAALAIGTVLSVGGIAAGQKILTGVWSPYVGVERQGFRVKDPTHLMAVGKEGEVSDYVADSTANDDDAAATAAVPAPPPRAKAEAAPIKDNADWAWAFKLPELSSERMFLDLRNYFIGRHAGVLVYFPFLAVALLLFVVDAGWRDPARAAVLVSIMGFILFFLIWVGFNYHGGVGFIGNRYFVGAYPAGLFLVGRLRPRLATLLGFLLGGLFLGTVVFAPLGLQVNEPSLQVPARAKPFAYLPFDFNIAKMIPGYRGFSCGAVYFKGRRDRISNDGEWLTVEGAGDTDVFLSRLDERRKVAFLLRNYAPGNVVKLSVGRSQVEARFPDEPPPPGGQRQIVELDLGEPDLRFKEWFDKPWVYIWYLHIDPRVAAEPAWFGEDDGKLVGVRVLYLGDKDVLERDVYGVRFVSAEVPAEVAPGAEFKVRVDVVNTSTTVWSGESGVRVRLAYRWYQADGTVAASVPYRTDFGKDVAPGEEVQREMRIATPTRAGTYTLVIEPIYEGVRWFSEVSPDYRRSVPVRVARGG